LNDRSEHPQKQLVIPDGRAYRQLLLIFPFGGILLRRATHGQIPF
jgi:hypothetical protein